MRTQEVCALADLMEEFRDHSLNSDFHVHAWPTVRRASECLDGTAPDQLRQVQRWLRDSHEREVVRGAWLVALARSTHRDLASSVAWTWVVQGTNELERAGWVALSLVLAPQPGVEIALEDFEDVSGYRTFPVVARSTDARLIEAARNKLAEPLPPAYFDEWGPVDPEVQDEVYVRVVALLAALGPAANEPDVAESLLHYVAQVDPNGKVVWQAAAHALAVASIGEPRRAQELLAAVRRVGEPAQEALVLKHIALNGGHFDLVIDPVIDLLRHSADGPAGLAVGAFGVELLNTLVQSDSERAREAAKEIAVERILNESTPDTQRLIHLIQLSSIDTAWTLEAIDSLLVISDNPRAVGGAIPFLSDVDPSLHARSREILVARYERDDYTPTRQQILRELAELQDSGAAEFLRSVANSDDPMSALALELVSQ